MSLGERIRDWWAHWLPTEREHRARLSSIPLEDADRVAAILLGTQAVLPLPETAEPRSDGVDAYTAAFVARNAGVCVAIELREDHLAFDPEAGVAPGAVES